MTSHEDPLAPSSTWLLAVLEGFSGSGLLPLREVTPQGYLPSEEHQGGRTAFRESSWFELGCCETSGADF